MRVRRADQPALLPSLGRITPGPDPAARRPRHPRQPRQPQRQGRPPGNPPGRRPAVVPAPVLTGSQPDRAGLRQDQALDARHSEAHRRRRLATPRCPHCHHRTARVPELHPQRRLWFNLRRTRSSPKKNLQPIERAGAIRPQAGPCRHGSCLLRVYSRAMSPPGTPGTATTAVWQRGLERGARRSHICSSEHAAGRPR